MSEKLEFENSSKEAARLPAEDSENESSLSSEWFDQVRAVGVSPLQSPVKKDHSTKFEILEGKIAIDQDRPIVAILDDYRYNKIGLNDKHGFSHGELSARMAEENDLNVMRIQLEVKKNGEYNMPNALNELDKAIEEGKISLGNGDILNLSFANTETFESMSSFLGMEITAENVKEKREEIFAAMKARLQSDGLSERRKQSLEELLSINEGIQKLQARGIEVIAGGGNDGPDYFNFGFMMADKQYSALTSSGGQADYSAKNSLTEDGRGQVDFYFQNVDLFDPTSIEQQKGYYTVDGTKIKLPASEFGIQTPTKPEFSLGRQASLSDSPFMRTRLTAQETDKAEKPPFSTLRVRETLPDFSTWRRGSFVTTAQGTSFVNVFKLSDEYKKQAMKQDR